MDLPVAQELFGSGRGYQLMLVEVARGADAEATQMALQSDPRLAGRYQVFLEDNYTRRNTQALQDIQVTARAISIIALLAVILGTYNATSLSLVERRRQIGILRVVGFKPGSVRQMLLLQALFQGLISYGLALLLALAFVAYQQSIGQLYAFGWPLSFTLTPGAVILGLVLDLGFSSLGALLATRSMISASPVQAMAI
jgi:ABC-type antimicrobial peptide transport system permease subunit